jgi:hypothetical protein
VCVFFFFLPRAPSDLLKRLWKWESLFIGALLVDPEGRFVYWGLPRDSKRGLWKWSISLNPSTYGDLIPSSYCDVRRFPAGYLNLEQNFAGVYAN